MRFHFEGLKFYNNGKNELVLAKISRYFRYLEKFGPKVLTAESHMAGNWLNVSKLN